MNVSKRTITLHSLWLNYRSQKPPRPQLHRLILPAILGRRVTRGIVTRRSDGCSVQLVLLRLRLIQGHNAAEAQVVCARAHLTLAARANHIARTILVGAEIRPAAVDFLGLVRLAGIEGSIRSLRVADDASLAGKLRIVVWPIPVGGPLPHVARHIIKAIAVGGKLRYRRN